MAAKGGVDEGTMPGARLPLSEYWTGGGTFTSVRTRLSAAHWHRTADDNSSIEQGWKGISRHQHRGLTGMASLSKEGRRTLAGVVTIHVQAGAPIFARL